MAFNQSGTGSITDSARWGGLGKTTYTGGAGSQIVVSGIKTYSGGATLNTMNTGELVVSTSSTGPANNPTNGSFGTGTLTIGATSMRATTGNDITIGNAITFSGNPTFATVAAEKSLIFTGDANLGAGTRTLTVNVGSTVAGKLVDFQGEISSATATSGILKAGTGTLQLSGNNTYTGNTTVTGGTLNITGTYTGNSTTSSLLLGTAAANTVVNVSNNMTLFTIAGANLAGSSTAYNQTAGTVNVSPTATTNNYVAKAGSGYFNLTGGTYQQNSNRFSVTDLGATAVGVAYVGGTGTLDLAATTSMILAYSGMGSLTVGPGGTVDRSTGTGNFWLTTNAGAYGVLNVAGGSFDTKGSAIRVGNTNAGGQVGFVNLAKGTLTLGLNGTNAINAANGGSVYYNYSGGTLKAANNLSAAVQVTNANLTSISTIFGPIDNSAAVGDMSQNFAGGLTVDTDGFAVAYTSPLLGATGNGVKQANISVTGGTGYIGAPLVQFTGGTLATNGSPASGYAVINASTGAVTGIVITSPGQYTVDPTITLTGGGGTGASAALNALTANATDSGLTKINAGSLTLTAVNTYAGPTLVSGGTLALSGSGAVNSSDGITVSGSGSKLLQASSAAITPAVTLTQGTLTGSGTINTVNVGAGTGGIISNNDGIAGASLTIGTLTFNGGATVNTFSSTIAAPIVTTSLSSNIAGTVTVNPTAASWTTGSTYDLISYDGGSIGGAGFGQFALGTVTGFSARQSVGAFGNSGTAITLAVAGDTPYWVGDGDDNWNVTSTNNWKLVTAGTYTTFLASDDVLFNDNATGAGPIAVNIDAANVTPTSTTFNNSTKDYVLSSSGGFGISTGSLIKSGTGTATLSNANTFTGGVTISGGTLALGNAGALNSTAGSENTVDFGTSTAGTLALAGNSVVIANLTGSVAGPVVTNAMGSAVANSTLTVGNSSNVSGTFAGILQDGTGGGTLALTKVGTGTLTLTGANTYTGPTTVAAGTLTIGASNVIGDSSPVILNGSGNINTADGVVETLHSIQSSAGTGTLTLGTSAAAGSADISLLNDSEIRLVQVGVNGILRLAPGVTLTQASGGTITQLGDNEVITFDVGSGGLANITGDINTGDGNGAINKIGSGILRLTSALSKFGGGTVIDNGTLEFDSIANINTASSLGDADFFDILQIGSTGTPATLKMIGTNAANSSNRAVQLGDAGGTINIDQAAQTLTLNGVVSNANTGGALTKTGSGTLTLANTNTYTGTTNITAGTLQIGAGSTTGSIANTSSIINDATLAFNRSDALSMSTVISGTGVVNQIGAGTTTLSGASANTYTGLTTVTAGILELNKTASVNAIASNVGGGGSDKTTDILVNGGALNWLASDQVSDNASINIISGLINFGSANETIYDFNNSGGSVNYGTGNVTIVDPTWSGGTNEIHGNTTFGVLNVSGGTNTVFGTAGPGGGPGTLTAGSSGGLNFSGTTSPNITVNSDIATAGRIVLAGNVASTVTTGTASITSGGVALNPGQLDLGAAIRTFTVDDGAAATDLLVSAQVIGSVGLTKAGAGTLELSGTNTYTGVTTISAGKLVVNGSTTSNTDVQSVGTLSGSGTITGNVFGAGTLDLNNLTVGPLTVAGTYNISGSHNFEIDAASSMFDEIVGITALTYDGMLNVTNLSGSFLAGQVFDLFDFSSQSGAFDAINLPTLPGSLTWKDFSGTPFDYASGSIEVAATAVIPEPSTLVLGGLGILGFAGLRLRRRRLSGK